MKKNLLFLASLSLMLTTLNQKLIAQTYNWDGSANSDFYNTTNWTSTDGPVVFDNSSFKIVRVHNVGTSPVLSQFIDWQPGVFDVTAGNFTVNSEFNVFFNDFLNGTVTINTGGILTCRNIIRVGREGQGTVNIYGTMRCQNTDTWQGIFIGALNGGNGTVNVQNGGLISGGYQVEVGTRNNYPIGTLNVNEGAISEAYWTTAVGPNGTLNVNGGTVNAGQALIIGDLFVDTAGTEGTLGSIVGALNLNSGMVTVNQNDLNAPFIGFHANSKLYIDNGTLRIMRTGIDFTSTINAAVSAGQIVPAAGKQIAVAYDGIYTTVTAEQVFDVSDMTHSKFTLYPNPTSDFINIANGNGNLNFSIYNMQGRQIANASNVSRLDVSALAQGIYVVKATDETAQTILKFVKK